MAYIYVEDPIQEGPKPTVILAGTDGNAFSIMGNVTRAMKAYGREHDDYNAALMAKLFRAEATMGDYDNLLQTCFKYCEVE